MAVAAAVAVTVTTAAGATRATTLNGAGSSLIAPAIAVWAPAYAKAAGVEINYSAVGSGAGIAAITAKTVDFGASDAPLSDSQASACGDCVQIPWALSATVPTYNIPGLHSGQLRLDGPTLAKIYLGQITNWSDPAIKKLNPGTSLPNLTITTIHRSDGSGDTYAFTDYLSHVSPQWASQVGNATSVAWPGGVGGAKNAGVAAAIASTPGSIGYISVAYVIQNHLDWTKMKNAAGNFVLASAPDIEAAAQTVKSVPAGNKMSIVDPPASASKAWPLSTFTYVIVHTTSPQSSDLRHFIFWALSPKAQKLINNSFLVFAPIPKVVLVAAEKTLNQVHS
ncbi:MAG: phosphate ABC transporter substrate-binding protein PstS [Actinobacteria bacterium]|nr:phosphate ABC transporter substrate-binding protein PstS [Actinomycetota bacterium]MBV8480125.1 phosphate ABC transporter substrate-binding protein PstS [Actinomycetota bacterium]